MKSYRASDAAQTVVSQGRSPSALKAATVGVELQARRLPGCLADWALPLTGFSNVTIIRSSVDLDATKGLTVTDKPRRLVGQAPFVVNAGLSYSSESGRTNATVLYNVVGDRIFAAGVVPLPNIVEKSRNVIDLSLRFPVMGSLSGRVDARNLLDARYRYMQGNLEREGFNAGRTFSVGFSWQQ